MSLSRAGFSAASNKIIVHAKELDISNAKINGNKATASPINDDSEELTLTVKKALEPGEVTVELNMAGKITDSMVGIYPCNFEHEGQKKRLLATQFESHHAREVFPCVDEPAAKAEFELSLSGPNDCPVFLSNTPISKTKVVDGRKQVLFEKTPTMSTYLLAFVCGELESLTAKAKDGTEVRTWATPDNVRQTEFALDVAVKCLDFYDQYFGVEYPLEKCDMVALPDFAAGAMENWGLVTYRESAMLVDERTTSLPSKQWVALVVAHELAHQWFGKLSNHGVVD